MRTQYASGRTSLPQPTVTRVSSGTIMGDDNTYRFFLVGKNRVGYSPASEPKSLLVADNSKVRIAATTFSTFSWEDWRSFIVSVGTTDDYTESRVIYRQNLYEADQLTVISLEDVVLNDDYIINGTGIVTQFPTSNVPNGYRVQLSSTSRVYEFVSGSTATADSINVYTATGGRWVYVESNSLYEPSATCNTELAEVSPDSFESAPIESFVSSPVPIKYYIKNDTSQPVTTGQLNLNEYISDSALGASFFVYIHGYVNHSTNTLDTTNIDGVNTYQQYPSTNIRITADLAANCSLVISVIPDVVTSSAILKGSFISLYPMIVPYTTIEQVKYWDEPVADIATLKDLATIQYKNGQARLVQSLSRVYVYKSSSSLDDNGDTVLNPNGNSGNGRWLASEASVLPGTITADKLADDVLELLDTSIGTGTVTISTPTTYNIDLDTVTSDYLVLKCPVTDVLNSGTIINCSATLENNQTKAIIVELRQLTSIVSLHSSFSFPGGLTPVLSGNTKSDLVILTIVKDSSGTVKKRAFLVQKDIG